MRLDEIMTERVISVGPDDRASTAWSRMQRERIRHLVVLDAGRLVGVISERDLGGPAGDSLRRGRRVNEFMRKQVTTAAPNTTLRQAANLMRGQSIGSLPVVENGRVVGMVTATDVLDELGRGATRPAVTAKRRSMRLPPAAARAATRKKARAGRATRARQQARGRDDSEPHAAQPTRRIVPELGRSRVRVPDSERRAPMPESIPRSSKRESGRTSVAETPAYIRAVGIPFDDADRDYVRRKLGRKLGKFARFIERTSVRIEDVNGPRGGVDKRCRIKVVLSGMPDVIVEEQDHELQAAMDGALERAARAVRRDVQRFQSMRR